MTTANLRCFLHPSLSLSLSLSRFRARSDFLPPSLVFTLPVSPPSFAPRHLHIPGPLAGPMAVAAAMPVLDSEDEGHRDRT